MKLSFKFRCFFWYFSHFKVPLIGYLKPKLRILTSEKAVISIALNRHSRNHWGSMYFGALAVGADVAGGIHGFYHADLAGYRVSLVFKSFQAKFLKRPESEVFFVSESGSLVQEMIQETIRSKVRINKMIPIKAYTNYYEDRQEVASFMLELSVKYP